MEVLFTFVGVYRKADDGEPSVILKEVDGTHRLVIHLDEAVALLVDTAAQYADGVEPYGFPILHALTIRLLARTDTRIKRVCVSSKDEGAVTSTLHLVHGDEQWVQETSLADGIAIVAVTKCDLAIDGALIDQIDKRNKDPNSAVALDEAMWHAEHDDDLPKS